MDNAKEVVLSEIILEGSKAFPVERKYLVFRTGYSDRAVRMAINDLRNDGIRICSNSHRSGYWIAEDDQDYRSFKADLISRIEEMSKMIRAMDRNLPGQIGGLDGRTQDVC